MSVAAALILVEISLQVFYRATGTFYEQMPASIRANAEYPVLLYEPHPFLPFVLKPTPRVWLNLDTTSPPGQNRPAWIDHRINQLNGRGPEVTMPKPAGVFRIVALGESTTFSIHTREAQSWPVVLEGRLNAEPGDHPRYEVLNFGTPRATSVYSLVAFATKVVHLQPDLLIAYHGVNDASTWRFPGLKPDHSHSFADMKPVPGWVEWVPAAAFRSATVTFLVQQLALRLERNFAERDNLRPGPMRIPEGIGILLDNYRSMKAVAGAYKAGFMTATFHVMNEHDEYGKAIGQLNRSLLEWGRTEQVPVADLAARIPHDDESVHSDGAHFTAKGDRMVAEILAETIHGLK